jgi:phage-related protein
MRRVVFHHKAFPQDVRNKIGRAVFLLQNGEILKMPLSRSMPIIGKGVRELRVKGVDGIFRVFYLLKSEDGVFVFHAFMKKTEKTPPLEIELARVRLKELYHGKS